MPFKIQRVPRGLNELLNIFGGATPTELEDRVRATVDALQFYSWQQRVVLGANNAALAEGGTVTVTPSTTNWVVLISGSVTVIKTGTMTALRVAYGALLNGAATQFPALKSEELGPFGATETGAATMAFVPPYPMVFPPNTAFAAILSILGTDATANVVVGCHVGIFG